MSLNHINHAFHFMHSVHKAIHDMKPLKKKKNAVIAFFMAFLFGCPGMGLYLWSWLDFFISLALVFFVVLVLLPTLVGESIAIPLGFLVSGIYAVYRVNSSNQHLGRTH